MFVLFLPTFAQTNSTPKSPEDKAKAITGWMKSNLKLTDDQVKKVYPINEKYAAKNQELQTSTASKMGKLKTLKANDKAKDAELKSIFTADQFSQYQAKKEELKEKFKEEMKAKKKGE